MKRIILIIFALAVSASIRAQDSGDMNLQLRKFTQFYSNLNKSYIEPVDNDQLIEKAIVEILAELDPHSAYISREEMISVSESFEGRFSGIGVQINVMLDTMRVSGVIAGGPSEEVGLQPGDRLIAVNGKSIVGMPQNEAIKLLRGPKGSTVFVQAMRLGESEPLTFRITRDDISLETIDASYMAAPGVGYIKVNRFAQTTMEEMRNAFRSFNDPDALILDLRGNGGGLLSQAIEMSNFFLPKNSLIVSTEGRTVADETYRANREGTYRRGKVVVLMDEFSASASEIVSGALQDWDRAVIVGRRSYGKGLVQRQYPLADGSAVNITVSKYLTPSGRAIQRPYESGHADEYRLSFSERFSEGYLDTLDRTNNMLHYTLRLKKEVYGGGGIYPDFYVPQDTLGYTDYYGELIRRGVIYEYSNNYLDVNRSRLLAMYPDFESFSSNFNVNDQMLAELVELGRLREAPLDQEELTISRRVIERTLKVYIARSLWGQSDAYRISNQDDPVMLKALEVIRNWDSMARGIATDNI